MNDSICFFTGQPAKVSGFDVNLKGYHYMCDCCGRYVLNRHLFDHKDSRGDLDSKTLTNCAFEAKKLYDSEIVSIWYAQRTDPSVRIPNNFTYRIVSDFERLDINHSQKPGNLLRLIASKLNDSMPFDFIKITFSDLVELKIQNENELIHWIQMLHKDGFVKFKDERIDFENDETFLKCLRKNLVKSDFYSLTPEGWEKVGDVRLKTSTVFIAMAFTAPEQCPIAPAEIRGAIISACTSKGWNPKLVDEEQHNDGIVDKIISLINKSEFVVADLTYQKSGVYFEAGYAAGQGKQVIFTVSEEDFNNCHFDVKHLNLIVWKSLEDLTSRLAVRIEATMGNLSN